MDNRFLRHKLWTFREHGTDFREHSWTLAIFRFSFSQYTLSRIHSRRGFVSEIGSVPDDLFAKMFINVHEIVHDSFLSFVRRANAVRTLEHDAFESYVSGIFVNNWAILFFPYLFSKCYKCSVWVAWWHLMDLVCFQVVHEMRISSVNVCYSVSHN